MKANYWYRYEMAALLLIIWAKVIQGMVTWLYVWLVGLTKVLMLAAAGTYCAIASTTFTDSYNVTEEADRLQQADTTFDMQDEKM